MRTLGFVLAVLAPAVVAAPGVPEVVTYVNADTVTVGQRFAVEYRVTYADSLRAVEPVSLEGGTCRVLDATWTKEDAPGDGRVVRIGRVTFIPASIDSVYVPPQVLAFVSPAGDTLVASTDPVWLPLQYLSAQSQDIRPLKSQWEVGPNWLLWIAIAAGALALAALLVWWIRRRRRRAAPPAPRVVIPPDLTALTELERIEAMGLVARGEFKTFYTMVVDVVRRYLEARFGVQALDRTTGEILHDLERSGKRVERLDSLLNEADLVKFAKYEPQAAAANAAIETARAIVVATTPRVSPPAESQAGGVGG